MYIKRVVIDGFKSYGNRVELTDWDPNFCAITGENGSGKSNILDAICFVLGISQLSQVRASTMQQLVYKEGQAKVNKASVTIYFDNRESRGGPVGYESFDEIAVTRQVIIGGRNKYLINGHTAQQSRVQNLFHSVQLNVNNPHFLIMQGRITKVLNMKPPEILSMIEEAAGTRMYETKKIAALNTIAKKDVKVKEITSRLTEEITPELEKLRGECDAYRKWSAGEAEIRRLERLVIASRFYDAEQSMMQSKKNLNGQQMQLESLRTEKDDLQIRIQECNDKIADIAAERQQQVHAKFVKLEENVANESKRLVKQTSIWENFSKVLNDEISENVKLQTSYEKSKKNLDAHNEILREKQVFRDECESVLRDQSSELVALESQQIGIDVGDSCEDGRQGSLPQQLMETERLHCEASASVEQADMKIMHLNEQIEAKRLIIIESKQAFQRQDKTRSCLQDKVNALSSSIQRTDSASAIKTSLNELNAEITVAQNTVDKLTLEHSSLHTECSRFAFDFTSPDAAFDRSRVKGRLAKLLKLREREYALALEVLAGARLYHVVVDAQNTGKALLERGCLKNRITIIPLNKIRCQAMSANVVRRARELVGDGNVWPALSLICYESDVDAAMKFVFGASFVCKDSNTAKCVTFDENIKRKCVTMEGDVFDPKGTLSGGARQATKPVLLRLKALLEIDDELTIALKKLEMLVLKRNELTHTLKSFHELSQQHELQLHELVLLESRLKQSTHQQAKTAVEEMIAQRTEIDEQKKNAAANMERLTVKAAELKNAIADYDSGRQNKTQEITQRVVQLKEDIVTAKQRLTCAKQNVHRLDMEKTALSADVVALQTQIANGETSIECVREKILVSQKSVSNVKQSFEAAQSALAKEQALLSERDSELHVLNEEKERLEMRKGDVELEARKLEHVLSRAEKLRETASQKVMKWLKQYEWIAAEKHLFGRRNTDYDFTVMDAAATERKLVIKQNEFAALSKHINKKAMMMKEKAETQYQELMKKRTIIGNDRTKIEAVIEELDRKKNEALQKTWVKVNKDFGSVFSTLLPGTQAKLEPPEGGTVLDGLEVKVAFGDVWKESLTELSGGQRSLLALSLILALLLFKPAPFYILDEVDAALDLSHTQNIGHVLKTRFSKSQFIVVSLKEGMFSNANVIFQTKFVNGVSTVKRTVSKDTHS